MIDESVTTTAREVGNFAEEYDLALIPDAATVRVTLDGTEYILPQTGYRAGDDYAYYRYGAPYDASTNICDFSEYPLSLSCANYGTNGYTELRTPTAGTYSFKVETLTETVETTECFEKAVKSIAGSGRLVVTFTSTNDGFIANHTVAEINEAYSEGKEIIADYPYGNYHSFYHLMGLGVGEATFCNSGVSGNYIEFDRFYLSANGTVVKTTKTVTASD